MWTGHDCADKQTDGDVTPNPPPPFKKNADGKIPKS